MDDVNRKKEKKVKKCIDENFPSNNKRNNFELSSSSKRNSVSPSNNSINISNHKSENIQNIRNYRKSHSSRKRYYKNNFNSYSNNKNRNINICKIDKSKNKKENEKVNNAIKLVDDKELCQNNENKKIVNPKIIVNCNIRNNNKWNSSTNNLQNIIKEKIKYMYLEFKKEIKKDQLPNINKKRKLSCPQLSPPIITENNINKLNSNISLLKKKKINTLLSKKHKKIELFEKKKKRKGVKKKYRRLIKKSLIFDSFDEKSDIENYLEGNSISPENIWIIYFDSLLFISTLFISFFQPLTLVINNFLIKNENIFIIFLQIFIDFVFLTDFILSFFRGYYNNEYKLIMNNRKIIIHYLKTDFFCDLIEAIPTYIISKYIIEDLSRNYTFFEYSSSIQIIIFKLLLVICKPIKTIKIFFKQKNKIIENVYEYISENYYFEKSFTFLIHSIAFFLIIHLFICVDIFLGYQRYPNWLLFQDTINKSFFSQYIASCYFIISSLTTVGYGDITCQSSIERVFQIFIIILGIIIYSFIVSTICHNIKKRNDSQIKLNKDMKILEEMRRTYPLMSFDLYFKIHQHLIKVSKKRQKIENSLLINSLPDKIKKSILFAIHSKTINNFNIFKGCKNSNFILNIMSRFISIRYKKNDMIIIEGEMIENIIFVKDGLLALELIIDKNDVEMSINKYKVKNFIGFSEKKENKEKKPVNNQNLFDSKELSFEEMKSEIDSIIMNSQKKIFENLKQSIDITNNYYIDLGRIDSSSQRCLVENDDFKYLKVINIRKNDFYGDVPMFLQKPSPLSLIVKSKFADIFILRKNDAITISRTYPNIWKRIHNKSYHNLLEIKKMTLKVLKKYQKKENIAQLNILKKIVSKNINENNKITKFRKKKSEKNKKSKDITIDSCLSNLTSGIQQEFKPKTYKNIKNCSTIKSSEDNNITKEFKSIINDLNINVSSKNDNKNENNLKNKNENIIQKKVLVDDKKIEMKIFNFFVSEEDNWLNSQKSTVKLDKRKENKDIITSNSLKHNSSFFKNYEECLLSQRIGKNQSNNDDNNSSNYLDICEYQRKIKSKKNDNQNNDDELALYGPKTSRFIGKNDSTSDVIVQNDNNMVNTLKNKNDDNFININNKRKFVTLEDIDVEFANQIRKKINISIRNNKIKQLWNMRKDKNDNNDDNLNEDHNEKKHRVSTGIFGINFLPPSIINDYQNDNLNDIDIDKEINKSIISDTEKLSQLLHLTIENESSNIFSKKKIFNNKLLKLTLSDSFEIKNSYENINILTKGKIANNKKYKKDIKFMIKEYVKESNSINKLKKTIKTNKSNLEDKNEKNKIFDEIKHSSSNMNLFPVDISSILSNKSNTNQSNFLSLGDSSVKNLKTLDENNKLKKKINDEKKKRNKSSLNKLRIPHSKKKNKKDIEDDKYGPKTVKNSALLCDLIETKQKNEDSKFSDKYGEENRIKNFQNNLPKYNSVLSVNTNKDNVSSVISILPDVNPKKRIVFKNQIDLDKDENNDKIIQSFENSQKKINEKTNCLIY